MKSFFLICFLILLSKAFPGNNLPRPFPGEGPALHSHPFLSECCRLSSCRCTIQDVALAACAYPAHISKPKPFISVSLDAGEGLALQEFFLNSTEIPMTYRISDFFDLFPGLPEGKLHQQPHSCRKLAFNVELASWPAGMGCVEQLAWGLSIGFYHGF